MDASPEAKKIKRHHQPWFDKEYRDTKRYILSLFSREPEASEIKERMKEYRQLIKRKRQEFMEESTITLVMKAEKEPWLLRPWINKNPIPWQISVEKANKHFS